MNRINFSQTIKDYDPTMYRDSISQKISELLEEYTRTFSKTMIVRFDVTYPKTYIGVEDNSDMSALMKLIAVRLRVKKKVQNLNAMWYKEFAKNFATQGDFGHESP